PLSESSAWAAPCVRAHVRAQGVMGCSHAKTARSSNRVRPCSLPIRPKVRETPRQTIVVAGPADSLLRIAGSLPLAAESFANSSSWDAMIPLAWPLRRSPAEGLSLRDDARRLKPSIASPPRALRCPQSMPTKRSVVEVRAALLDALKADLIGPFLPEDHPGGGEETLSLPPSRWYLTGFLAPKAGAIPDVDDQDSQGELAVGVEGQADDEGVVEPEP